MEYEDRKVKVTVVESHCPKYKEGDVICFTGSEIDKEHSDKLLASSPFYSTYTIPAGTY